MGASGLSRRRALSTAAGLGLGLPVLVACGEDKTTTGSDPTPTPSSGGASPSPSAPTSPGATSGATSGAFASTADIPVGGGVVFEEQQAVVTQPTEGEFRCFSFVCTHSGCPVNEVTDEIVCPCHGSRFTLTDGSPTSGPAPSPLAPIEILVDGDAISLA